jgi:hypothetical protein
MLIDEIKQIEPLCLPSTTTDVVWLDDVIEVIEQYYSISCNDENRDEKILYLAKSLEGKQLSLHELVENANWLLNNIK